MVFSNVEIGETGVKPSIFRRLQTFQDFDPTAGDVAAAFIEESLVGVGTLNADVAANAVESYEESETPITKKEFQQSEYFREGIEYYPTMTKQSAQVLARVVDEEKRRGLIISRASTPETVLGFLSGFGVGMFEPKNLAIGVGTSLVGGAVANRVVGAQRLARAMVKYGKYKTLLAKGGAEGLVAAAIAEPSNRESAKTLQRDYTMIDTLFNVALSGSLGGLINVAPAYIGAKVRKYKTRSIVADELDAATSQIVEGREVDVEPVEAIYRNRVNKGNAEKYIDYVNDLEITALREIEDLKLKFPEKAVEIDNLINRKQQAIQELSNQPKSVGLTQFIKSLGGVREEAGELKSIGITNKSRPSFINKRGLTLDEVGEAAFEAGYFSERPTVPELLEALDGDFRGYRPVFNDEGNASAAYLDSLKREIDDVQDRLTELGFDDSDKAQLSALSKDIEAAKEIEVTIRGIEARTKKEADKIRAAIAKVNSPDNNTAVDIEDINNFDAKKDDLSRRKVIDEDEMALEEEIAAMREGGFLTDEEIDVLNELDSINEEGIIEAHQAAYICLTRG